MGQETGLAIREVQAIEPVLDITPDEARRSLQAIRQFQAVVQAEMVRGHDFGVIPGTDKPTLLKPGAEKMAKLLKCADKYDIEECKEDWKEPFFYYRVKCRLVLIGTEITISEGFGSANSYEAKWRYRWMFESELPEGVDKKQLKRRQGKARKTGRPYVQYRMDNPDIFDLVNTIQKMAKKRALVDAALSAGRLSDLFTQDIEEINGFADAEEADVVDHEPDEEEKKKALEAVLKKINGFKTIEALEKWADKQNIEKSVMKDDILKAIEAKLGDLEKEPKTPEPKAPEKSEPSEAPAKGSESPEMSEEDQLFAQIREVLEAAGHDKTYIDKRMEGLKPQSADALRDILANEKKKLKNGNGKNEQA
jgi:hypothetical protein